VTSLTLKWRWRAAVTTLWVPPLIRVVSFARLLSWLETDAGDRLATDPTLDDAALARWVDALLQRLPGPWRRTCLLRSAVLYHLLRRAGRPVELVIGVRRQRQEVGGTAAPTPPAPHSPSSSGTLAAHAWLVRDGAPYLEWSSPEHLEEHVLIARFPDGRLPTS